jgi:hypothetical protein
VKFSVTWKCIVENGKTETPTSNFKNDSRILPARAIKSSPSTHRSWTPNVLDSSFDAAEETNRPYEKLVGALVVDTVALAL